MDLIGKTINNRYEIIEKIGQGGMATVYKARCKVLNRHVAVKVLKEEFLEDAEFVKKFRDEAQSAGSLSHPNIVSIYDVGKEGNINYIIMELVDGKTLKEYIQEKGVVQYTKALKIAMQIASALEEAHSHHIVHRDIKPHNIMLTRELMVKVTDFGIAKVTTNATISNLTTTVGSVHYFSPEHARGGFTDEKSDLYSLGVVMYEMVTGILPFDAETPVAVALKHIQEIPKAPREINKDVPLAVNSIIMKALEKNTAKRYQTATEMIKDIYAAIKYPDDEVPSIEKANGKDFDKTQVVPIVGMAGLEKAREEEQNNNIPASDYLDADEEKLDISTMKYSNPEYRRGRRNARAGSRQRVEEENKEEEEQEEKEKNYKTARFGTDSLIDKDAFSFKSNKEKGKLHLDDEADMQEDPDKKKKKKMDNDKKIKIIKISIAVVLAFILILTGITVVNFINTVKEKNAEKAKIVAPDLIGKDFEKMVEECKEKGIKLIETENRSYDRQIAEGCIIYQSVDPGITLKVKEIEVTVSKGKPIVTIPDLIKKDYRVAKAELENEGLVVKEDFVINPDYAENTIIKTSPEKGASIAEGTEITIQISKGNGKTKFSMPTLTNMSEAAARSMISEKGLVLSKVKYTQDKSKQDGYVLEQSIVPNVETEEGSLVEITVNKLAKSKTITVNTAEVIPATDGDNEKSYSIKVTANVDGIENNVYNGTHKLSDKSFSFVVNGYTTAIVKVYVDNKISKEISVAF